MMLELTMLQLKNTKPLLPKTIPSMSQSWLTELEKIYEINGIHFLTPQKLQD